MGIINFIFTIFIWVVSLAVSAAVFYFIIKLAVGAAIKDSNNANLENIITRAVEKALQNQSKNNNDTEEKQQ